MKSLLIIVLLSTATAINASAQGCVAIKSTGGMCTMDHADMASEGGTGSKWLFNANNRYYNSYKHFVGKDEQEQRVEAGSQVINHAYTLDLAMSRILNSRWLLSC
jgi:hypothetical protein